MSVTFRRLGFLADLLTCLFITLVSHGAAFFYAPLLELALPAYMGEPPCLC